MRRFEVCSRRARRRYRDPRARSAGARAEGRPSAPPRGAISVRGGWPVRGLGRVGPGLALCLAVMAALARRAGGARVSIRMVGPRPGLHALALGRRAGARGRRAALVAIGRARRDALARATRPRDPRARHRAGRIRDSLADAGEARRVPPIHDVTTDPEDPPAFVAVVARRAGARNPVEYAGPAVAAQQRAAYPDLVPLDLAAPPERVFRGGRGGRAGSRLGDRGGGAGGGPARGDGHDVLVRLQGRRRRAGPGPRHRQPSRRPLALSDRRRRPRRQRRPHPRVPRTDAGERRFRGVTPRGGVS